MFYEWGFSFKLFKNKCHRLLLWTFHGNETHVKEFNKGLKIHYFITCGHSSTIISEHDSPKLEQICTQLWASSNCQVEHLDQLGINRLCLTWPEKAPLPPRRLPTWIPVVRWRYLFPVFPNARRVGPVGRVLKGRAGEAVREERRGPARSSTNRKEAETWCGNTTAPTSTEKRTRLLILSRGGRTHRKSNYPRRRVRLRSPLVLSSEVCVDGGSPGRLRLCSPWELESGVSVWGEMCSKLIF